MGWCRLLGRVRNRLLTALELLSPRVLMSVVWRLLSEGLFRTWSLLMAGGLGMLLLTLLSGGGGVVEVGL